MATCETRLATLERMAPAPGRTVRYPDDPVDFAREVLRFTPDPWQERAMRWPGRQLLLNCSRQSGKSTTTAAIALHTAVHIPGSLILLVSPSQRQSSELFRKVSDFLDVMTDRPGMVEDNRLSCKFRNKSRIVSLPSSESTVRGFSGAALIIEDEASRVSDELYNAMRPMLAVSNGRMILMSTPFGRRGHFFQAWADGGDEWHRIEVKATDCPRISADFLASERRALGDWWYRQEYLCSFEQSITSVFSVESLDRAERDDALPPLWE